MNVAKLHAFVEQSFPLIRVKIDKVFAATKERSGSTRINLSKFTNDLNKICKKFSIKFISEIETDTEKNKSPKISAVCFEPDNENRLAKIELTIFNPNIRRIDLDEKNWNFFHYKVLETILHELIHRAQYKLGKIRPTTLIFKPTAAAHSDKKLMEDQTYLGEIDEIESYAHDCVQFWHYTNSNTKLTMRNLKKEFNKDSTIHAIQYYYDAFHGDINHPAVVRFFGKVMAWSKIITPIAASLPEAPKFVQKYYKRIEVSNGKLVLS